ncbi:MAG: hypothetical protein JRI59_01675, partial [Deltaproteobacteria bacterium]|nr:hypothetical protein [Deltaproteobacteria bacterium]
MRKFREKCRVQAAWLGVLLLPGLLLAACQRPPGPGELDRVLKASWRTYVRRFISPAGRVVVPQREGETISEAQAYALLRA